MLIKVTMADIERAEVVLYCDCGGQNGQIFALKMDGQEEGAKGYYVDVLLPHGSREQCEEARQQLLEKEAVNSAT